MSDPQGDILKLGGKALGLLNVPFERANKFVGTLASPGMKAGAPLQEYIIKRATQFGARFAGVPQEVLEAEAEKLSPHIDWKELKRIPGATVTALKLLVPWPGMGKDAKTIGRVMSENYEALNKRPAPWGLEMGMDLAAETLMGLGVAGQFAAAKGGQRFGGSVVNTGKLTSAEIKQAKRLFTVQGIAKMTPAQTRIEIAKAGIGAAVETGKPTLTAAEKLTTMVRAAKPYRGKTEQLQHIEKADRARRAEALLKAGQDPRIAFKESTRPLAGELPVAAFEAPESGLSIEEVSDLFQKIRVSDKLYFQKLNTSQALEKVLAGQIPQRSEIALLQNLFGPDLSKAIMKHYPLHVKVGAGMMDIWNLPKATVASMDLSAPLRQGLILAPGHPKEWLKAWGPMFKAVFSEGYAKELDNALLTNRFAKLRDGAGLYHAPWGREAALLGEREEMFMSALVHRIPGIKQSERGYVAFLNQLRANVFDDIAEQWISSGLLPEKNPKAFKDLATYINHATGRGSLGKFDRAAAEMNALFFSPRFQASRFQLGADLVASDPAVRKIVAGDLAAFVGTGLTVLSLAKLGGADVDLDPRSTDFGKIQVGNTRYDFWVGYSQLARLVAQEITGQRESGGRVTDVNRLKVMVNFLRTKASPSVGFAWDVTSGKTMIGERVEPTVGGISEQAWNSVAPLVWQDVAAAIKYQGLDGSTPITAAGAFFGLGVATYPQSPYQKEYWTKERAALETYGISWEDLSPTEAKYLVITNKSIGQAENEAAMEKQGRVSDLNAMVEAQARAGLEVTGNLTPELQKVLKNASVAIGGLPRKFGGWDMNDARYKQYKELLARYLNDGRGMFAGAKWRALPPEGRRVILENNIAAAKERAKGKVQYDAEQEASKRLNQGRGR